MKAAFSEIKQLRKNIEDLENTVALVHDAVAENISKNPGNEENIRKIYEPRLILLGKLIETKVFYTAKL